MAVMLALTEDQKQEGQW